MNKELKQLTIDELYALSAKIDDDPQTIGQKLFPNRPSDLQVCIKMIGQWAMNQTAVLESTRDERHDVAFIFHKVGERIWHQLPCYAQHVKVNVVEINDSRIGVGY